MKKLLFLAAFSAMLSASASDQYLYWMVDDAATVDDGTVLVQGGQYQAMIKDSNGYLDLYANPGNATSKSYGQVFTFELGESMDTFAKLGGSASSFVVELYNYGDASAPGSWIGQATLSWDNGNITTGGMGHANSASAISFTAAPEPTSGMLLLIGVAGLALRRRKIRVA